MAVSLATRLAAVKLGGNAVYADLRPGDRFRFPRSHEWAEFVKGKGGWYQDREGLRRYRTHPGTAVVKL